MTTMTIRDFIRGALAPGEYELTRYGRPRWRVTVEAVGVGDLRVGLRTESPPCPEAGEGLDMVVTAADKGDGTPGSGSITVVPAALAKKAGLL